MFDFDKLAEYASNTGDALALRLVTLAHDVENYHRDPENFAPVDTSAGVGAQNPQTAQDAGTSAASSGDK